MKAIPLLAAAVLVTTGCASTGADVAATAAPPAEVAPESLEVAAVVELEPKPFASPGLRCETEYVIGSRIPRERCYRPLTEAEEQLNADMARSEIEFARDMVLLEEQQRIEEMMRRRQGTDF
ncbi:MAG TPA: hypothetical protein VF339_14015 [Gammaproteobacteria bacterium]